jgi:ribosomal protein L29
MNDAAAPTPKKLEHEKTPEEVLGDRAELITQSIGRNESEIEAARRTIARLERDNETLRDQQLRLGQAAWLLFENKVKLDSRFAEVKELVAQ